MIEHLELSSERDMLLEWGLAEAHRLEDFAPAPLLKRLASDPFSVMSPEDETDLARAIQCARWPMLRFVLPLGLTWYRGDLPTADMGGMMFHRGNRGFLAAAPSGRLDELARRYKDVPSDPGFVESLEGMLCAPFDRDRQPRLIFVATDIAEPYELIEGTRRSVMILRGSESGTVQVCLGVGNRLPDWP